MSRLASRLPILVLVVLMTTWGTCPCVFGKMLGPKAEAAPAAATQAAPEAAAPC